MRTVFWAVFGAICLVLLDKWAGLGFIWPEMSQKPPIRPQTGPILHPSVRFRPPEVWDNVVNLVDERFRRGGFQ